jgi:hypothetical protein
MPALPAKKRLVAHHTANTDFSMKFININGQKVRL